MGAALTLRDLNHRIQFRPAALSPGAGHSAKEHDLARFRISSWLVGALVIAVVGALNSRERRTVSDPYYAPLIGATWHPPPYEMKEMAVDVHYDRGWPIWHTRRSECFAAHNAPLYLAGGWNVTSASDDVDLEITFDEEFDIDSAVPSPTDRIRLLFDGFVALAVFSLSVILSELASRCVRSSNRRRQSIDNHSNAI